MTDFNMVAGKGIASNAKPGKRGAGNPRFIPKEYQMLKAPGAGSEERAEVQSKSIGELA